MARLLLRFSLNHDTSSKTRNSIFAAVDKVLPQGAPTMADSKNGTALFEFKSITAKTAVQIVAAVEASSAASTNGATLDHIWAMIDQ